MARPAAAIRNRCISSPPGETRVSPPAPITMPRRSWPLSATARPSAQARTSSQRGHDGRRCLRTERLRQFDQRQHRNQRGQLVRASARLPERRQHRRRRLGQRPGHHPRRQWHCAVSRDQQPCRHSRAVRQLRPPRPASGTAPRSSQRDTTFRHRHCRASEHLAGRAGYGTVPRSQDRHPLRPHSRHAVVRSLLSAAPSPNDLSIGVLYTAGLQTDGATPASNPWGIAADANDNVWITGMANGGLMELSSVGACSRPTAAGVTRPSNRQRSIYPSGRCRSARQHRDRR